MADFLTKAGTASDLEKHMAGTNQRHVSGRHPLMPKVAKGAEEDEKKGGTKIAKERQRIREGA